MQAGAPSFPNILSGVAPSVTLVNFTTMNRDSRTDPPSSETPGSGSDFFTLSARVSRTFRVRGRVQLDAIAEGFNLTNRRNVLTRNTNFGPGAYPANPSPTFGQSTGVAGRGRFSAACALASE